MRSGLLVGLLPVVAGLFAACGPPEIARPRCEQQDNANLGTQWIGIKKDAMLTCAATLAGPSSWTGEALFAGAKGDALGKFCLYKHATLGAVEEPHKDGEPDETPTCAPKAHSMDPVEARAQLEAALVPGAVTNLTQDGAVVAAQASPQSSLGTVRGYLRERMHEATGGLKTNVPPFEQGMKPNTLKRYVATAILDSAPLKADAVNHRAGLVPKIGDINDAHGSLMAFLANDVACPQSDASGGGDIDCGVRTHTLLALPLRAADKEDHENGGYFGRRSDLARALYEAVVTYRDRFDENAALEKKDGSGVLDARLVIGLSLAWEPEPKAKQPCGFGPGTDSVSLAVQEALTFAACHGVTVIAAAGNHAGDAEGRMCPADFERLTVPDTAACSAAYTTYDKKMGNTTVTTDFATEFAAVFPGGKLSQPADTSQFAPRLVYSVGGVGAADAPLAPARPGSRPWLVEPAEGGVSAMEALSSSPAIDESPRSGTSVAAANLAGIAAGTLANNPWLTPPELMKLLYDSGQTTKLVVEVCSQSNGGCDGQRVRHPMLCKAIGQTCLPAPGSTVSQAVSDLSDPLAASMMTTAPPSSLADAQGLTSVAAAPWVIEQPVLGGCPDCVWSVGNRSIDIINPAWATTPTTVTRLVFTANVPNTGTSGGTTPVEISANGFTERIVGLPFGTVSVSMTAVDSDNLVVTQTIVRVP